MPTCRRQCNTAPSDAVVSKNKEEAEGYDIKGGRRRQVRYLHRCRIPSSSSFHDTVVNKNEEEVEQCGADNRRDSVMLHRTMTVQHRYRGGSVASYQTMRWSTGMKMRQNTVSSTQRRQSITTSTQRRRCGITPNDVMVNENEEEVEQYDTNTDASPTSSSFSDVDADTE
ncbi:hypothetical protein B296_00007811 [Ensete ventricosum]|uniref:Uncharacterized protein n=1 Tax=Ensete ventricosum TaxID=4639 RepID=A0A426ZY48_ENSVE|nr:hypothetical protein B296_00007811 [Ensete ventricosum]